MLADQQQPAVSARALVAKALVPAAASFPDLAPIPIQTAGLAPRDARLALAIHRTCLQRWLTLEHLLDLFLRQPIATIEPPLRAVLISGAAQIVFFDRLPAHAVVDESVSLARLLVRPGAGGLVNAVLRRLSELVAETVRNEPWVPAADRLPIDGGYVRLAQPRLPGDRRAYLAVATSHPPFIVERWIKTFGDETATRLLLMGVRTPPTIVAVEHDFSGTPGPWRPHEQPGFLVWSGSNQELVGFLHDHPDRRVQDPASALAVAATAALVPPPTLVVDPCAGRGTKTRQLAAAFPDATVIATDIDAARRQSLRRAFEDHPRVRAIDPQQMDLAVADGSADLMLLDVPCSNTAVLARRPEARYRLSADSIASLETMQRQIIAQNVGLVRTGGHVLYSSCSLEPAENHEQAAWLAAHARGRIVDEKLTLPAGHGDAYHDGGYYALICVGR